MSSYSFPEAYSSQYQYTTAHRGVYLSSKVNAVSAALARALNDDGSFHPLSMVKTFAFGLIARNAASANARVHLSGQLGTELTVTLEIDVSLPSGASDHIVRTVTENCRTLKFTSHGFESE